VAPTGRPHHFVRFSPPITPNILLKYYIAELCKKSTAVLKSEKLGLSAESGMDCSAAATRSVRTVKYVELIDNG
jgi:hypothetical protein